MNKVIGNWFFNKDTTNFSVDAGFNSSLASLNAKAFIASQTNRPLTRKFFPKKQWLNPNAQVLASLGSLEVRLARNKSEIRSAQALRYKVFYEEMSATPDAMNKLIRRDKDNYDKICDHLIVIDKSVTPKTSGAEAIVGTYRFLRDDMAMINGGFKTEAEYDVREMMQSYPDLNFMELGRACVLPKYRNKRTMELLWAGTYVYLQDNQIDVMLGCASFEGINPADIALELSFLNHYCDVPTQWKTQASCDDVVEMNHMAKKDVDAKLAMRKLPTLIKGYLRLGAYVGHQAVIDYKFNTIDVLVIMPVKNLNARHVEHFSNLVNMRRGVEN
jgi:putative hemolysin